MKVELQCGDTITIPEGCKAIIKDGSVAFKKEFEDGDVLHSEYSGTIVIFKEYEKKGSRYFYSHYNTDGSSNKNWNSATFRYATEEEKKEFFDTLRENGYQWNAEEKLVEKIRWRANNGEQYYSMNSDLKVHKNIDYHYTCDNKRHDSLNYFRTEKQTEEVAERVKELLKKYHNEIGE